MRRGLVVRNRFEFGVIENVLFSMCGLKIAQLLSEDTIAHTMFNIQDVSHSRKSNDKLVVHLEINSMADVVLHLKHRPFSDYR